ncbi:MAG: AAA family ATPase [Roseburia sp.]|nr:AAA family ATPase [Roseburia sp.]MBR2401577.1 AAA family ATPase [Lachnospiraceae bacterium]
MSKIITVWGNPGSGKSMFCCNLAKVLTAGKAKALIINADASTPMLPVWMPDRILETNMSIGNVMTALEINNALVAERVVILKEYPFIGVMGYAAGENPFSYPELKYNKIRQFIQEASKLVEYIILDCSSNMLNFFTPTAIESADLVVRVITPDLRGLNYLKAHKPLLTDEKFHFPMHLTFAGMARPFHAIDEMDHLIGGFDGLLPYSKEIERCGTSGQMFKALAYCNQRYISSLKLVRELIDASDEVIVKNVNSGTGDNTPNQAPEEPPENPSFDKGDDAL